MNYKDSSLKKHVIRPTWLTEYFRVGQDVKILIIDDEKGDPGGVWEILVLSNIVTDLKTEI